MTDLSTFVEPLRALLNDNDPDGIYMIETSQLISAIKLKVNIGKVPGYAISGDSVTPDLTPATDQKSYAILVFNAAQTFAGAMTRESFNTRAFSESIGAPTDMIDMIFREVYDLAHGDQCN